MLFFDMDGVICNLDAHYASHFGDYITENHSRSKFWKNVNGKKDFFKTIPMVRDMDLLLEKYMYDDPWCGDFSKPDVGICSTFGRNEQTWEDKMWWLDSHYPTSDISLLNRVLVPNKKFKAYYRKTYLDILVDDREDNIAAWNAVFPEHPYGILFNPSMSVRELDKKIERILSGGS